MSGIAYVLVGLALWPAASVLLGLLIGRAVRGKGRRVQAPVRPVDGGPLQRTWLC